jgi:hypothetical protein
MREENSLYYEENTLHFGGNIMFNMVKELYDDYQEMVVKPKRIFIRST